MISLFCFGSKSFSQTTFTGDVEADFNQPQAVLVLDNDGVFDVGFPDPPFPGETIVGWELLDLRLLYDPALDVLHVGLNYAGIGGDADGDGDPGTTGPLLDGEGGTDFPDFGGSESFVVSFDTDRDGLANVVVGVGGLADLTSFGAAVALVGQIPPLAFGDPLPAHTGVLFSTPSAMDPDVEFTIANFSQLPGFPESVRHGRSILFNVGAFTGSLADAGIGEDTIVSHLIVMGRIGFDNLGDGDEVSDQYEEEGLRVSAFSDCGRVGAYVDDPSDHPATDDILPVSPPFVLTTQCFEGDESSDSGLFTFDFVSPLDPKNELTEAQWVALSFLDIEDSGTPGRGNTMFQLNDPDGLVETIPVPTGPNGSQVEVSFPEGTIQRGARRRLRQLLAGVGDQDDSGAIDSLCYVLFPCPLDFDIKLDGPIGPIPQDEEPTLSVVVRNLDQERKTVRGILTVRQMPDGIETVLRGPRRLRLRREFDNEENPLLVPCRIPDEMKPRGSSTTLRFSARIVHLESGLVLAHDVLDVEVTRE